MRKLIFLSLVGLFLIGCGGRVCRELTRTSKQLGEFRSIAELAHQKDPNLVSERDLDNVYFVYDTIIESTEAACIVEDLIERID
jgi:hypothetical protein